MTRFPCPYLKGEVELTKVENLEVLFFSTRLLRTNLIELPIAADLRLARKESV